MRVSRDDGLDESLDTKVLSEEWRQAAAETYLKDYKNSNVFLSIVLS